MQGFRVPNPTGGGDPAPRLPNPLLHQVEGLVESAVEQSRSYRFRTPGRAVSIPDRWPPGWDGCRRRSQFDGFGLP